MGHWCVKWKLKILAKNKLNIVIVSVIVLWGDYVGNFYVDNIKMNGTFFFAQRKKGDFSFFFLSFTSFYRNKWEISGKIKLRRRPQIKEGKFNEKKL